MYTLEQTVVIDNGTGFIKSGIAGESAPQSIIPTIVGHPRHPDLMSNYTKEKKFFGDEALLKERVVTLNYPVQRGRLYQKRKIEGSVGMFAEKSFDNWNDMEDLYEHLFKHVLKVNPEEYNFMITEPPHNYEPLRAKLAEIMFEKFNIPAIYLGVGSVMSLISTGKLTGLVIDIGYGTANCVPIYEGYMLHSAIQRMDLAGNDLTTYMFEQLGYKGYNFQPRSPLERLLVSDIKEEMCYVATDFDAEVKKFEADPSSIDKTFILPDGQEIVLGKERFICPEALFNPGFVKSEQMGLHQGAYTAIQECNINLRRDLYENVYLFGGSSLFPGIDQRLKREINALSADSVSVEVKLQPERELASWVGSSIFATLPHFENISFHADEYKEIGSAGIEKCNMYLA